MKGALRTWVVAGLALAAAGLVITLGTVGSAAEVREARAPATTVGIGRGASPAGAVDATAAPAPRSVTTPPALVATDRPVVGRPRLPIPDPLPEDPYGPDPDRPIGTIAIPAIGLDAELGQGMTLTEIDRGPAHWPGTALPGGLGNVVVAGHRTTRTAPFRHLNALVPGDEIVFAVGDREVTYLVTETFVVEPTDVWITTQTHHRVVTLFACHPVGSAAQRIVVRGELRPVPLPSAVA